MSLPRKVVAAAIVLFVGVTAAWLFFRRGASEAEQGPPAASERLVIRAPTAAADAANPWTKPAAPPELPWQKEVAQVQPSPPANAQPPQAKLEPPQAHLEPPQPVAGAAASVANNASSDMAARFAEALRSSAPTVEAAKAFDAPRNDRQATLSIAAVPPTSVGPGGQQQTHRIVDGDTLGRLAERDLGSTQRQTEIFDANRDTLKDPELLPIGVELRIPADPPLRAVPRP